MKPFRWMIAMFAVLVVVAPATATPVSAATTDPPFSVLSTQRGPEDRLPKSLRDSWGPMGYPKRARYLRRTSDAFRFFIMPGRDRKMCVLGASATDPEVRTLGICGPRSTLIRRPLFITMNRQGEMSRIWGIIRDGFTRVTIGDQRYPIRSNFFAFELPASSTTTVVFTGPHRRRTENITTL